MGSPSIFTCILALGFVTSAHASGCSQTRLDLIAVLDGSGSIDSPDFLKQKNAVIQLAQDLNLGSNSQRFGVVVFSSSVTDTISLSGNFRTLKSQISRIRQPIGGTNTHLGIQAMKQMFQSQRRTGVKQVGIVITDGKSGSESATTRAALEARRVGITMFAIGVGRGSKKSELVAIASTSANVVYLDNFSQLKSKFKSLIKRICPKVNGRWTSWSRSSSRSCSKTCGGGSRTVIQSRSCTNPRPSNGGIACSGPTTRTSVERCNTNCCPRTGGWSNWKTQSRTSCSKTCGGGVITVRQSRSCTNPTPACGGTNCGGSTRRTFTQSCNTKCCPVSGGWSTWKTQSRSSCSKTCGGGAITVRQSRSCTNPKPTCGGANCKGSGTKVFTQSCNTFNCKVDGGYTKWSPPSRGPCSKSCGGGTRTVTRTRTCTNPAPRYGGKNCVGKATNRAKETCNVRKCPVDGGYSKWSPPSQGTCSKSCGGGTRTVTRTRTCTNPAPLYGGKSCVGKATNRAKETCNVRKCPVHGGWSKFTTKSRSSCSVTCGNGVVRVYQSRTCTNPTPKYGGRNCSGSATKDFTESCNSPVQCLSCDGCNYVNGVGFLRHPTDCRFFLQCFGWGSSYVTKQCPAGLYWNQEHLTCTFPSASNCTTSATVAPPVSVVSPPPPPPPGPCTRKAVAGKPSHYSEKVDSHGLLERKCAPGTIFDGASCGCVHGGSVPVQGGCKDDLYLPLNNDLKDHSSHKLYIESNGVNITKGGMATFANNAVIRIHRFSNMDFGKTLDISFLLHKSQKTSKDEAVVTNAECKQTGSIYIILKTRAIQFRVRNKKGHFSKLSVPLTKTTSRVRLNVHKGVMTGYVGNVSKKTSFKGRIGKVHCAIQIGRGTGYASFNGQLKDFKVSMCRP